MADIADADGTEGLAGQAFTMIRIPFRPVSLAGYSVFVNQSHRERQNEGDDSTGHWPANRVGSKAEHDARMGESPNIDVVVSHAGVEDCDQLVVSRK